MGEDLWLLPQRALYWPAARLLLIADLHLGKTDTWRAAGLPVSAALAARALDESLHRLAAALALTAAHRVLVLGDLLHAPAGHSEELLARVAAWRRSYPIPLALVPGNHDRRVERLAALWSLDIHPAHIAEGPFAFVHDPADAASPDHYTFTGHVHPMCVCSGRGDALRLPCFLFRAARTPRPAGALAILPAFGGMNSGAVIRPEPADLVFALADHHVVDVTRGC